MRKIIVLLGVAVFLRVAFGQPNDPPRRIWYKEAPRVNDAPRGWHFYDFTWIADQNGDGCDELLIGQEPLLRGEGQVDPLNRVELYLGDPDQMSEEPAFVFEARDSLEIMGRLVSYLGSLTAQGAHDFAINTAMYAPNQGNGDRIQYAEVNIYRGGIGRFDTNADFNLRGSISAYQLNRPIDSNGDGFNDLICGSYSNGRYQTRVYFGGADFDTIPDVIIPDYVGYCFAGNFNGDGYDDFVLVYGQADFFLGGDPPSGESVLTISQDQFEGYGFESLRACPDVNNDGYDDWILTMWRPDDPYGGAAWLFFGSDSLDAEPDRILQIDPTPVYGGKGNYGGDFNGDGRGDVIARQIDMRTFFGSPWFDSNPGVIWGGWFRRTQGAYGDFNGDGVDDCVIVAYDDHPHYLLMAIFAGNRDWIVSVPREDSDQLPLTPTLTASAFPNPFNDQTRLTLRLPATGDLTLRLCDLNAREVRRFTLEHAQAGEQAFQINGAGLPSGLFFLSVNLKSESKTYQTTLTIIHLN